MNQARGLKALWILGENVESITFIQFSRRVSEDIGYRGQSMLDCILRKALPKLQYAHSMLHFEWFPIT
jgi:hypothetical protein